MKEKHIPYYTVLESLNSKECPICFLIKSRVEKYFETLLYEGINDIGFREKFNESRGFCNLHSHKFLNYHDGLAIAIVYREVLANYLKEISTNKYQYKNISIHCMICHLVEGKQKEYISLIKEYLSDEEFKLAFEQSYGLCIPHYFAVYKIIENLPDWFKQFHIKKYQNLFNTLDKYIKSCNASLGEKRPQLSGDEELCWISAVQSIVGFEGKEQD